MRTVLKVGQRVDITREESTGCGYQSTMFEGKATLVKLVRKCHTAIPPFEIWIVKFDDDEEPVQRSIPVKLPSVSGMSSSLARAPESRNLLAFMAAAGLSDDWTDPSGHDVTAYVSGKVLSNDVGAVELTSNNRINEELLVHLEHPGAKIVLNLNTLLVLASGYVRQQFDMAAEAVKNVKCQNFGLGISCNCPDCTKSQQELEKDFGLDG